MIIYTHQKSKKRKPNAKQRELARNWEDLLKRYETKKPVKVNTSAKPFVSPKPFIRETPKYPSLNSGLGTCTKPIHGKVYTGTAMNEAVAKSDLRDAREVLEYIRKKY